MSKEKEMESLLSTLDDTAAEHDVLVGRRAVLQRALGIEKAGIDTTSPLGKYFLEHYSGENDPEAIAAHANAMGVPMRSATPAPEAPVGESEVPTPVVYEPTGSVERLSLASGAESDSTFNEDPKQTALRAAESVGERGGTFESKAATFLGVLTAAANQGDPRVVLSENGTRPPW